MTLEDDLENLFPGKAKKVETYKKEIVERDQFFDLARDFFSTKVSPKLKSMESIFEKYGLFFHQDNELTTKLSSLNSSQPRIAYNYHEARQ